MLLCFLFQDVIKKMIYLCFVSQVVRLASNPSSLVSGQRVWGGQMELVSFVFVLLSQNLDGSWMDLSRS